MCVLQLIGGELKSMCSEASRAGMGTSMCTVRSGCGTGTSICMVLAIPYTCDRRSTNAAVSPPKAWPRRPKTALTTSVTPGGAGGWLSKGTGTVLRFTIQQSQSPGPGACEEDGAAFGLNARSAYSLP